jgi:predicted RNase H-like nuclease (RuvC/YqgF family)
MRKIVNYKGGWISITKTLPIEGDLIYSKGKLENFKEDKENFPVWTLESATEDLKLSVDILDMSDIEDRIEDLEEHNIDLENKIGELEYELRYLSNQLDGVDEDIEVKTLLDQMKISITNKLFKYLTIEQLDELELKYNLKLKL